MLIAPWHFSFTVSDIEQSIRFYRDVLGMELVHRQEQANEYTRKFVGYPDAHLKVAQFRIAGLPTAVPVMCWSWWSTWRRGGEGGYPDQEHRHRAPGLRGRRCPGRV